MLNQPSLKKIIIIDYTAFIAWLAPLVMWSVLLFLEFVQSGRITYSIFLLTNIVITFLAIPILIWRIHLINAIFDDGATAQAKISNIYFYRDRGRIDYVYIFQGKEYTSVNVVHRVRQTRQLKVGDRVTIMVDRNKPKRALIRDLYMQMPED